MTANIRPRRSVLYMPGSNGRAIEKARTLPADALILDLEDAVAPDAKDEARTQVCKVVRGRGFGHRELIIRINALSTPWGEADLAAAIEAAPDAILIPKVSSAADIREIAERIASPVQSLWAMIETPRSILEVASIAGAGERLTCLVMGTNDLIKELRAKPVPGRENLYAALGMAVAAARAFGLSVIDGVHNEIKDENGFRAACRQGREFGFDGKTLIHPSQIAPCNDLFSPSAAEVETARNIIRVFDMQENQDKGAIAIDGRMVERLHLEIACATVALADSIAAREESHA